MVSFTTLPNGQSLVCLGDEPYNEKNRPLWKGLTGCCARLSVCIKTVIYSNLMRNTIVRHWMPEAGGRTESEESVVISYGR